MVLRHWVEFEIVFGGAGEKISSFPPWKSFPLERSHHSFLLLTSFSYCCWLRYQLHHLVHRGHDYLRCDHLDCDLLCLHCHPCTWTWWVC